MFQLIERRPVVWGSNDGVNRITGTIDWRVSKGRDAGFSTKKTHVILKTLFTIFKFVFFLLLTGTSAVSAQSSFKVIGGIPHLPTVDPSTVNSPISGMLIYSITDNQPLIYNGSSWETLCSSNIDSTPVNDFLEIKSGIPFLPSLGEDPIGIIEMGAVYLSKTQNAMMIYDGDRWESVARIVGKGSFAENSGFSTDSGLKVSKLPAFNDNPIGVSMGAIYINTLSKAIRYYDGIVWKDISCLPIISAIPVTGITNISAVSGVEIRNNGGTPVITQGICWSTNPNPHIGLNTRTSTLIIGSDIGFFSSVINGLEADKIYYVRAYAINESGIVYSDNITFRTAMADRPIIETIEIDANVSVVYANSGGIISSDGGSQIYLRGITWSVVGDPISDPAAIITSDGSGVGPYPSQITDLLRNTDYYVRAYAENVSGTAYGNMYHFKTDPATAPVLSSPNIKVRDITDVSAVSEVTIINNGGEAISGRGICWSTDRVNFVYVPSLASGPADVGTFVCNITNLESGKTYFIKGYATNSVGTSFSSESSFITTSLPTLTTIVPHSYDAASFKTGWFPGLDGTRASSGGDITSNGVSLITKRGICWSTSPEPTIALPTKTVENVTGSGTGTFHTSFSSLVPATTYYVKAYATNSKGTAYGNLHIFTTPQPPVLTTTAASLVTSTTVTSGGAIASDGGMPVTERGLCWSLTNNPTINGSHSSNGIGTGHFISTITGLKGGTTYYIRAYGINATGVGYSTNVVEFMTAPAEKATITTIEVPDTSDPLAISGGHITVDGGADISSRGIIWSFTPDFDPEFFLINKIENIGGSATFNCSIKELAPNKTYYVKAYATNSAGVAYGNEINFKTYTIASLTTKDVEASSISSTTAVGGGDIFSDGGNRVTSSGIVWDTAMNPTTILATKTDGGIGIGGFLHNFNALAGSTKYYVRAYAVNKAGTAYGATKSFTTLPPSFAVIQTVDVTKITGSTALSGGRVLSNGGGLIFESGIVWSTISGFLPSTATSQKTIQQATGNFSSNISGLDPGTTYYVRAYATNSAGTTFASNELSFRTALLATVTTLTPTVGSITSTLATSGGYNINNGGSFITSKGICWSSTKNDPTIADSIRKIGSGSTSFTADLTDLLGSTTYFVRAFATNSAGTAYGNRESFMTLPAVHATVVTEKISEITGNTATGGGNIISNGGASVNTRGIVWSSDPDFLPEDASTNRTEQTGYEKGIFVSYLNNLAQGTTYYVRAYAVSDAGPSYGNKVSFSTPTMATITTNPPNFVTATTAVSGGMISDSGGSDVLKRGVFWSTIDGFTPDVLSADQTDDGTGTGRFDSVLKNLAADTTYYVKAYASTITGTSYGAQFSFRTSQPVKATITTVLAAEITDTTANSGGDITDEGGATTNIRGIKWSSQPGFDPEVAGEKIEQIGAGGIGIFSCTIIGLIRGTTYYIYAYATNDAGTKYGEMRSFTTSETAAIPEKATIFTNLPDFVTSSRAVLGGTITNSGGSAVLNKGVFWSTVQGFTPDISSTNKTNDGTGTGNFYSYLKNLQSDTTYYVMAYAVTSAGISYGDPVSFTTQPPTKATLTTVSATDITGDSANSGGAISDEGGATTHTRGLIWSSDPDFNPVTATANKTIEIGAGTGSFGSKITGLNLDTTYYVYAYAENVAGRSYGGKISFTTPKKAVIETNSPGIVTNTTAVVGGTIISSGGLNVLKRGVFWSTVAGFVPNITSADKTEDGTDTGSFSTELKNLTPATRYYVIAYAITVSGISFGEPVSFTTDQPTIAALTTVIPTKITGTTAESGGDISDEGGITVDTQGVLWSTQPNFDYDDILLSRTVQTGAGKGIFNSEITGLNPGTTYYLRAYAINEKGTAHGYELSFTTLNTATLSTNAISEDTGITAVSGGKILSDGGAPVFEQGICWSTSSLPTIGLSTRTSDQGLGLFTSNLIGLEPATMYFVRSYAINSVGTSYGDEISFTTKPILASVTTVDPEITSNDTASSGGVIRSNGGATITEYGIVWTTDKDIAPDTITLTRTSDGSGNGSFISNLTNLVKSTTYYVRAYATNSAGTTYGNQLTVVIFATSPLLDTHEASSITATTAVGGGQITSDGGSVVTQRGICWSTQRNPTIALITKTSNVDLGDGNFTGEMNGLLANTLYYVRAYAKNGIGVAYGFEKSFITLAEPTLTATTDITSIRATTATGGGQITDDGRSPILIRGIVWDTYSTPTIALNTKTVDDVTQGIGVFSGGLTGLTPDTIYYVRAYASNSVGTTYGSETTFRTNDVLLPVLSATSVIDISEYSVKGLGEVIDDGGMPVTARGFVWDTSNLPSIDLQTKIVNGTAGTGYFSEYCPGLIPGTSYYVRAYATNTKGTAYGDQATFTTSAAVPLLSDVTILPTIQMNNAEAVASLVFDGGALITDLGLIWNTIDEIPIATPGNSLSVGAAGTSISGSLGSLLPGTLYYVWAYGTNNQRGTGYSSSATTFATPDRAKLTTTPTVASITVSTATSGGTIISTGGMPILDRGVCWSTTTTEPTTSDSKTSIGPGSGGIGTFSSSLSGLTKGTLYHVRAYATNGIDTSYGSSVIFTTLDSPSVTTDFSVTSITANTAICAGEVLTNGGTAITSYGICWSTTSNPTILNSRTTNNGAWTGVFTASLGALTKGTVYHFRAYAINSVGTTYGGNFTFTTLAAVPTMSDVTISEKQKNSAKGTASQISDGGATITSLGLIWNTTNTIPVASPSNSLSIVPAGTSFSETFSGLLPGTTYYVWAYGTNVRGPGYSAFPTIFTTPNFATLTTTAPTVSITAISAISGGTISNIGEVPITDRGVCWSTTTTEPTTLDSTNSIGAGGTGTFSTSLTSLTKGTLYYVRAYAKNGVGTSYGGTVSFTTLDSPTVTTDSTVTSITTVSATCKGNVLGNGGTPITSYGVCWGTTADPTIQNSTKTINNGAWTGAFTANLGSLATATVYYFRAYATNSVGTTYGDNKTFTTVAIAPTVGNVTILNVATESADGSATIISNGGAAVIARGFVWSSSNTMPTLGIDNELPDTVSSGTVIANTISGLSEGPTYYIRAYATNVGGGTGYSPSASSFKICNPITLAHIEGVNGAPVTKTVTYDLVSSTISGTAKCWIAKNLGADQKAATVSDDTEPSAGWYWQFNRVKVQGYKHDGTTRTPNTIWPSLVSENSQWTATNDPCRLMFGGDWRIPTQAEWTAVDAAPQNWTTSSHAYASVLKLHNAGFLSSTSGALVERGISGRYWSSTNTTNTNYSYHLDISSSNSYVTNELKNFAYPVRCLRNDFVLSKPSVTNVTISNMTANSASGAAAVTSNGGAAVTARGLVWSATNLTPTVGDNVVVDMPGLGSFTNTLLGLSDGTTYYVRAYATNSEGTEYSPSVSSFKICIPFTVYHAAGFNGAPVDKTVVYNSVSSSISGTPKCWTTQNLGADRQAISVTDDTEISAGWYWRFDSSQGYKHDGSTRTPATTWISSISAAAAWTADRDPCRLLLGVGWRIPTQTEWTALDAAPQNWATNADAYSSVLKLHNAGFLFNHDGSLSLRLGATGQGFYWGSTNGYYLNMTSTTSVVAGPSKAGAYPIRCLRDEFVLSIPTVSNVNTSAMTPTSTDASATVSLDGGAAVTERGLVWSATDVTPTVDDNKVSGGLGTGNFTNTIASLSEALTYHVRAYATNSKGTAYSLLTKSFKICMPFTAVHTAGFNGAPVSKTVVYDAVSSSSTGTPKCWITRNLGASEQGTSVIDASETSAGWYWQFNRKQGYKHDGIIRTPSTTWISNITESSDWTASNDPCGLLLGSGWRIPTGSEWTAADAAQNWTTNVDSYLSVLKLHNAGYLDGGSLNARGGINGGGNYWSSTGTGTTTGYYLYMNSTNSIMGNSSKSSALPVRCLRDEFALSVPSVSNVSTGAMTNTSADGSATVTLSGGAAVFASGLVWSSTNANPTLLDNVLSSALSGIGSFMNTISGLSEGPTYYVRAFATNSEGTGYSPLVSSFKICVPFAVNHIAGASGAPVTKTVTYNSVNSSISGEARCWITQNLGADRQATSVTDAAEAAAGWYWQFNRKQGYKHDGTRTPTAWITTISESGDWTLVNDPCSLMLGTGWRMPNQLEWTAVDAAPQNWNKDTDGFASVLKLHNAGYLSPTWADLTSRGAYGNYWSTTSYNNTNGYFLTMGSGSSSVYYTTKVTFHPIRCLK